MDQDQSLDKLSYSILLDSKEIKAKEQNIQTPEEVKLQRRRKTSWVPDVCVMIYISL